MLSRVMRWWRVTSDAHKEHCLAMFMVILFVFFIGVWIGYGWHYSLTYWLK